MSVLCFSEATRRLIINPFVIASTAIVGGQLDTDHHFSTRAFRLGNGSLDYYIPGMNVVVHNIHNEENNIVDPDDFAEVQSVHINFTAGISQANQEFIYKCGLGQTLAQMMDKLSDTRASGPISPDQRVAIKGILSSGQQTMFFLLEQVDESTRPTLHYFGKWALNIYSRNGCRCYVAGSVGARIAWRQGRLSRKSRCRIFFVLTWHFYACDFAGGSSAMSVSQLQGPYSASVCLAQ